MKVTCLQLAERQADRKFFIGLINKQTNAAKAYVRRAQDWKWDAPEKERKAQNERAARIVKAVTAKKKKEINGEDAGVLERVNASLLIFSGAVGLVQKGRDDTEKVMIQLAKDLPAYAWAKGVHGFGEKALAVIVGEAGDLSNYANVGKLWRRLGLAPFKSDGVTKACSSWRKFGGLSADEWSDVGYSPRRLAEIYSVLTEPLFKLQSAVGGPYRAVYDRRRAHTAQTHPDWPPIQSHMDGLRIMTKKAISDLWSEWRRAAQRVPEKAKKDLPAAGIEHRSAAP